MTTSSADWPAQWLRGPLPLCALHTIAENQPIHGYGITRALETAGLGAIGGGTLYPLLSRLERDGLVETSWVPGDSGPARKTYSITRKGADHLDSESAAWTRFTNITTALLQARTEPTR